MVMVENSQFPNDEAPPRYSELRRITSIFFHRKLSLFGFCIISMLIITAVFAPIIAPYDPNDTAIEQQLQSPNLNHLLGTDMLGRDTFSRIVYGARTSLLVGILAVGLAALIGESLGLIAAFFGGKISDLIMRAIDAVMTIPPILNALVIASALGSGLRNVIIALAVGCIPVQARLMYGQALSIKPNDYILSSKAKGAKSLRIMLKHILPNAFPTLLVAITIELGTVILAEAGLSFLGVGIRPPTAAWGGMVFDGYKYLFGNPILSIAPGVAIMLVVFGFNMAGDGLRDALDPRLRGVID